MSVTYVVSNAAFSSSTVLYTVPTQAFSQTAGTFLYSRDLVIANGGTQTSYFAFGTGGTAATTAVSFAVPSGASLVLTNCQVPAGAQLWGVAASGTGNASVGYSTGVTY